MSETENPRTNDILPEHEVSTASQLINFGVFWGQVPDLNPMLPRPASKIRSMLVGFRLSMTVMIFNPQKLGWLHWLIIVSPGGRMRSP
jgi:hypothetical protein